VTCTLDASVGGPLANSYCTIAEADAYWQMRVREDEWVNRAADTKCRSLLQATRLLDDYVNWAGVPAKYTQPLAWPRWGLTTVAGDFIQPTVLPDQLKWATAELAMILCQVDPQVPIDAVVQGIKRVKADTVEVEFTGGTSGGVPPATPAQRVMVPRVWSLIARWAIGLAPGAASSGMIEIPLVRV
jgi:hypothetical protein